MPNEEYQRLLRSRRAASCGRAGCGGRASHDLDDADLLAARSATSAATTSAACIDAYRQADAVADRPCVVFAYTIKGWCAADRGPPANHSALLNHEQYRELARRARARTPTTRWRRFAPALTGGRACAAATGARLRRGSTARRRPPARSRRDVGREHTGTASTQQAFGRFFVDLTREAPDVAERVVTVSPDVGISTNLGGWINKAGVWSVGDRSTGSPTTRTRSCAGASTTTASTSSSASPR